MLLSNLPATCQNLSTAARQVPIVAWLAIASLGTFVFFALNQAFYYPLIHDDAFLAGVAKNLAFGHGWGSTTDYILPLRGEFNPFDHAITTGPGLLGAISIGIRLFGNEQWVARAIPLLLNLLLLFIFLNRLKAHLSTQTFWSIVTLLPLLFICLGTSPWIDPIGQVPAALYLANGALLLHDAHIGKNRHLLLGAGIFFGLAVLTKTVALCGVAGSLAALPLAACIGNRTRGALRWAVSALLIVLAGFMAPLLSWLLYQQYSLQDLPEQTLAIRNLITREFFLHIGGSGLGALLKAVDSGMLASYIIDQAQYHFQRNTATMAGFAGPPRLLFAIYTALLLFIPIMASLHQKHSRTLLLFLLAPVLSYLVWAYLLSSYVLFGLPIYTGLLLSLPALLIYAAQYRWLVATLCIYLLMSIALQTPQSLSGLPEDEFFRLRTAAHPKKSAAADIVRFMAENPQHRPFVGGCGWIMAYEIDYLWPGPGILKNCYEMLGEGLDFAGLHGATADQERNAQLWHMLRSRFSFISMPTANVKWTADVSFTFVENDVIRHAPEHIKKFGGLLEFCSQQVYTNEFYTLYHCSHEDLKRYVTANGGITFMPPQWTEEILLHHLKSGEQSLNSLLRPW